MNKVKIKAIWAVDLFENSESEQYPLIPVLKLLAEKQIAEIEPVYVLSPESLDLSLEFSPPWIKQYQPAAQKSLRSVIAKLGVPALLEPRVLLQAKPSLRFMVKSLVRYAKNSGADLIIMGTHSREGLARLFLGSFAESTVLYARVPVMVIGPHSDSKNFERILFATDFGSKAGEVFQKVLRLAKRLNARLTLLHSVSHPIEPFIQSGGFLLGGGWIDLPVYITKVEEMNREQADQWVEEAKRQGVASKSVFIPSAGSVSKSIVDYAKIHEIGLIAVGAESGPLASAFLGSTSRQVVRTAQCPVWVFRA